MEGWGAWVSALCIWKWGRAGRWWEGVYGEGEVVVEGVGDGGLENDVG